MLVTIKSQRVKINQSFQSFVHGHDTALKLII